MKTWIVLFFGYIASGQAIAAEQKLPPVLNYFPTCDYQVLAQSSASLRHKQPLSLESKSKLLNEIRQQASSQQADAVILTKRVVKKFSKSQSPQEMRRGLNNTYTLNFNYQLINNCDDLSPSERLTRYNERGNVSLDTRKLKTSLNIEVTIPSKPKLKRPDLQNHDVSMDKGVYGLTLGEDKEAVIAKLGDPSAEFYQFDQQILSFGRHHLFYFVDNKLVRIQNRQPMLNQTMANQIPIWDTFDNYNWQIEGQFGRGDIKSDIESQLTQHIVNNDKKRLTLSRNKVTLDLFFNRMTDPHTNTKVFRLDSFDYRANSYQAPKPLTQSDQDVTYAKVSAIFSSLKANKEIEEYPIDLSQSQGRIWLKPKEYLDIFNDSIVVRTKNKRVAAIVFYESAFSERERPVTPWYIGDFIVGQSLTDVRPYLDDNALEMYQDVLIDMDLFSLKLAFEETGNTTRLFQADLTIY